MTAQEYYLLAIQTLRILESRKGFVSAKTRKRIQQEVKKMSKENE